MRHLHHPKWVTPSIIEGMSCDESATFLKILHILPLLDRITQLFQISQQKSPNVSASFLRSLRLLELSAYR